MTAYTIGAFSPAASAHQPPLGRVAAVLPATPTAPPAGAGGATAGCYDTANNRDLFIASVNACRSLLNDLGDALVPSVGAGGPLGFAAFSPAAYRRANELPLVMIDAAIAADASAPPAGGAGATAGGYDTAPNRDAAITTITDLIASATAVKAVVDGSGLTGDAADAVTTVASAFSPACSTWRKPLAGGVAVPALPAAAPAGGVGADAGGWSTAVNRDLGITSVTDLVTLTNAIATACETAGIVDQ